MGLWQELNYHNKYTENNLKYADYKGGLWRSLNYHTFIPKEEQRAGGLWHSINYGSKDTIDKLNNYFGNTSDMSQQPLSQVENQSENMKNQYKYSVPFIPSNDNGKFDYAKASPLLEETLNKVEGELYNNKTPEKTNKKRRGALNRFIDVINIPQYVITNASKTSLDENKGKGRTGQSNNYSHGNYGFATKESLKDNLNEFLDRIKPLGKGAFEGLKAGNPVGQGNEKGRTNTEDVLNSLGWERNPNPDFKLTKPSTWDANNIAHGLTGFAGDVLLDPFDIDLGDLLRGSGKRIGKKTLENFGEENAEKVLQQLAEKGGNVGKEIVGEIDDDAIKHLANKVDELAGMRKGRGVTVGLGGAEATIIKPETLQNIGDKTIAPYVNAVFDKIGSTKLASKISTKKAYKDLARKDPYTLAKILKFQDYQRGQSALLSKKNKEVFEYANELMNNFSKEEQTLISDLIEKGDLFKPRKEYVDFLQTDEGQKYYEEVTNIRNQIGQHIKDIKQSGKDLNEISSQIDSLNTLKSKLDDIINIGDIKNFKSFDNIFNTDARNVLNNIIYKDVDEIKNYISGLDDFKSLSEEELNENAYKLRHIADKYLEDTPENLRPYVSGQEDINEIMYKLVGDSPKQRNATLNDIMKNLKYEEKEYEVPSIVDMAKNNVSKVEEPTPESIVDKIIKEAREQTASKKNLTIDDINSMSPGELAKFAKDRIENKSNKTFSMYDKDVYGVGDLIRPVGTDSEGVSFIDVVNRKGVDYYQLPDGKWYPTHKLEMVKSGSKPKPFSDMTDEELKIAMEEEGNVLDKIKNSIDKRRIKNGIENKESLSIIDNAKKNNFNVLDVNDVLSRSKEEKLSYINEIISTNQHLSKEIGNVSDNVDEWVVDRLIKNIYDNNTEAILNNKNNYSFRQPFVYKMVNDNFLSQGGAKRIPFNQLSDEGKKAYRTELSRLNSLSDDDFWKEWKTYKSTRNIDKLPFDNIDKLVNKDRSKWIQDADKRIVERASYAGADSEGKLIDEVANAREKLAYQMYRKPYDKLHEKGQQRVEKEINKLYGNVEPYGELNKIKSVVKDLKPYNVYDYNGIKILEPVNSKNSNNASDVQKWVKELPEEVQAFLSKNGVEIRVEDFKVGKADSVYDVGNNIITMLHKDDETVKAINSLRNEEVFPHEVAHAIGSEYSKSHKIPKGWASARRKDGVQWVSEYAEKSSKQAEDFADSFALYVKNPEKFIEQFPNRAKLITQTIDDMNITRKDILNIRKQTNFVPRSAFEVIDEGTRDLKVAREKIVNEMKDSVSIEEANKLYDKYDDMVYNSAEFNKHMKNILGEEKYNQLTFKGTRTSFDDLDIDNRIKDVVWDVKDKLDEMFKEEVESGNIDTEQYVTDYLTHILNPNLSKKETKKIKSIFSQSGITNPFAINRKLVKGSKVGNTVLEEGTKREINDAMKKIIGDETFFLEEIAPIYTARAIKHNELMYDDKFARNIADMFGTRITDLKDVPEGEKLVMSTKELKRYVKKHNLKPEQVLNYLGFNGDDIDSLVLPLIEVTPEQFTKMKAHIDDVHVDSLPEVMFNYINKSGKMQYKNDTKALLKLFDKYQYLYKLQVTAVNPGFHFRNYYSNQFQNWLDVGYEALKPETQIEASQLLRFAEGKETNKNKITTRFGKEYTYDEILDGAIRYGVYDEGFFAKDLPLAFNNETSARPGFGRRINPLDTEFIGYHYGRKIGNTVENQGRLANFIGNIKRGLSMEEAGEHTNKFLFDYSDLTEFEQQFMKRIFPFYTWTRKNIPLQLEMMATKPNKYRKLFVALNAIQDMTPKEERVDKEYVNDFAKDWIQLPGTVKNPEGRDEPVFWNPNLPYQDVSDLENFTNVDSAIRHLISNSSPAIKIPIELATNKNMYFDSPINRGEGHTKPAPGYLQPINYHKLHKGENVELKKISPELRYLLDQLTPIRNIGEMIEKQGLDRALHAFNTIGGIKVASYDYDKYKTWAIIDRLKELMSK